MGHNIPHYTDPARAAAHYVSGTIFHDEQTLFSLPVHVENEKARKAHLAAGKDIEAFLPPHKEGHPVYSGYLSPKGVKGLARAWLKGIWVDNNGRPKEMSNEKGDYAFNLNQFNPKTGKQAQEGLALPYQPNRLSDVTIDGYSGNPTHAHRVTLSLTIGGVEQIIVNKTIPSFTFNGKKLR